MFIYYVSCIYKSVRQLEFSAYLNLIFSSFCFTHSHNVPGICLSRRTKTFLMCHVLSQIWQRIHFLFVWEYARRETVRWQHKKDMTWKSIMQVRKLQAYSPVPQVSTGLMILRPFIRSLYPCSLWWPEQRLYS